MKQHVIQKLRAPVRLSQPGDMPLDGYFCLLPEMDGHPGPETILELLNSTRRVIPFFQVADDNVVLLTRLNIDWVVPGAQVDADWIMPKRLHAIREQSVRLQFFDGREMEGAVRWGSPLGADIRLSDFLNDPADFYPLVTRLGILMVNKNRVRETRVA